jgi:hypothetical protein
VTRAAPAAQRAGKWISRAATVTVTGLTGLAGAISHCHMRQLAAAPPLPSGGTCLIFGHVLGVRVISAPPSRTTISAIRAGNPR